MGRWRSAIAALLYGLGTIVLPGVHLAFHTDDHDHEGGGIRHRDHDDDDHDSDHDHHPHGAGSLAHFATAIADGPAAPLVLLSAPLVCPEPIAPHDDGALIAPHAAPSLARGPPLCSS